MSHQNTAPTTARQTPPMSVPAIDSMLEYLVAHWHVVEPAHAEQGLGGRICDLHRFNFLLWHEEDIARSPDVTDARIAQVKRAIDTYNQARNDSIEKVDDWLIEELGRRGVVAGPQAPAATETPGSAIDRLSILELRRFHMREQIDRADATAEHREKAAAAYGRARHAAEPLGRGARPARRRDLRRPAAAAGLPADEDV